MKTTTDLEADLPTSMKTVSFEEIIEGVRVRVTLDEQGRPVGVTAGCWAGDAERITRLALEAAQWRFREAGRLEASKHKRRKDAQEHWSNEWLGRAHVANTKLGKERLAHRARQLFAAKQDEDAKRLGKATRDYEGEEAKRNEITPHRARQYLETRKNPGGV